MKQSTFSAFVANSIKNLLQGYTKGIRMTAILILLLMGVSNVWGGNNITFQSGAFFYFDPYYSTTQTVDKGYIQLAARKYQNSGQDDYGWYTAVTTLTKIANTRLYYTSTFEGPAWTDNDLAFHGWAMISNSTAKGNGSTEYWTGSNSTWYSEFKNYGLNKNSTYLFVATSASKGQSIQPNGTGYLSGGYSALNSTQTIKTAVNGVDANSKATITVTSYKLTGNGTISAQQSASISTSAQNTTISAARTATTTLTVGSVTAGYKFDGWYTAATGGTQLSTSTTYTYYPTAATTVYARFSEIKYTVTVKNDGHGTTTPSDAQSNVGQVTGVGISATANNGYEFINWTITSGSGSFTNTTATTTTFKPTAASTIQANFSIINYNITYNNLNGVTHDNPTTYTIEDTPLTFTNPTSERTGYTFNGWSLASIAQGSTGHKTVTAQWTANTYIVAFNANGGSGTMSDQNFTYGTSQNLTANVFTRTGYTFAGWNTKADGTGTSYTDKQSVSNLSSTNSATVTLYAKWTIKQYTITYGVVDGANGAILYDGTEVTTSASATANYNTSHDFKAVPNQDYKIEGWYSDANGANKIDAAGTSNTYSIASLTENVNVYVKFVEAAEVMSKVTVAATVGGVVSQSGTVEVGNKTSTTFTATPAPGYRFGQWEYSEGIVKKTESNTNEQGSITITATKTGTLTANFVRVHTVNFFATPAAAGNATATATVNGNAITSGDKLDAKTSVTFTADVQNTYKGQCTFQRWVDGAGKTLSTETTFSHIVQEDITVKAIFKITQYTLTFSAGEGGHVSAIANNSAIASPASLDYNTSVTLTATPNANGAFAGWYEGANKVSSNAEYTIPLTENKTLEARFAKPTTIYFKPNSGWKEANARFAVYYWKSDSDNGWVDLTNVDCNGDIYEGFVPVGYSKFKFVRQNPNFSDNRWNNNEDTEETKHEWGQTGNLTIQAEKNLYDMNSKNITHIYFKPHGNWKQADAKFQAYYWNSDNDKEYVDMSHIDDDLNSQGIYRCLKNSRKNVLFYRVDPNNGYNKWNQTKDLLVPTDGTNLFSLTGGEWSEVTGEWQTYWDDSRWTTYSAPSYKLNIKTPENGTITVTKGGNAVASGATLKLGDEIKITFTPAASYELSNYLINYASETETDGVYTVCGPTNIIAEFDPIAPSRTVYLRPNEDWLRDNPVMAARVRKSSGGNDKWYVMNTTSEDYTGAYSCNIPNDYDQIIFVRLNPKGSDAANDGFNWTNAWNQTKELTIIDKDNDKTNDHKLRFAIGDKIVGGNDNDRYDGKWEENTPIWGLTANFNDWTAEKAIFMGYPGKLNTVPPFTPQHAFKLFNFFYAENSNYFGNAGTMKRENSEQWWTMDVNEQTNCQMKLDAKGDYIYQLRFLTVGPELRKQISVTYPAEKMYYLNYVEGNRWSYAISNTSDNTKSDKVSFFVSQGTATIKLTDANKAEKATKTFNIPEAGVYNFTLQHGPTPSISTELEKYTGNYYVRTDAAAGGWNTYKQAGNKMTYSSYADKNHNFDHYFCKWIANPEDANGNYTSYTNVKFCVANDYSHAISDEMNGDEYIEINAVPVGCIPQSANVRFMWNSQTNEVNRAYISGSGEIKDRYLVLSGDEKLTDLNDKNFKVEGLNPNESGFADLGNWIYQLDAKAGKGASISLTATYNNRVQTFFGTSAATVASEGNNDTYPVRFIYDFKTNNLMAAWLLLETENDVQGGGDGLNANMLLLRKHHEQAQQIQLANTLSKVGTAYGVMTFDKYFLNNRDKNGNVLPKANEKSIYERALYWVSFPFDVCIRDVFGFGEYMDTWIMEYYDGEARAKNGAWVDSESYWTYMTNVNDTLKAGVGYVLCLDLDKMNYESSVWANTAEVSLYFPSAEPIGTIDVNQAVSIDVPEHECTINRPTHNGNRTIADANWNVIGVPRFINLNITLDGGKIDQQDVVYYYQYNASNNTYQAAVNSGEQTFQTMQAYMVQYAGEINWWVMANWTPQQLAARRNANATPEKVNLRLEIAQDDVAADKTFIQLQEEGATADFDMNKDLTKIINVGTNIYTIISQGSVLTAGNVMPMSECVVPVGVKVDTDGEYTFRMPDGTEGMVVELIDYYTNTRTNLLLFDYTVDLSEGTCNDRFALHIQPSKSGVTTGIEGAYPQTLPEGKGTKFLIDGKLIIRTAEGEVFDAQGHRL